MTDQRGVLLAAPGSRVAGLESRRDDPLVAAALRGRFGVVRQSAGAEKLLAAYAPITRLGWTLTVSVPEAVAFAEITKLRGIVCTVAGCLALVLVGGLWFLLHTLRDRQRIETALRDSEGRLQAILDNSPAVIYVKDLEGRYLLINRRFEAVFHVERNTISGRTDAEAFPAALAEQLWTSDRAVLAAGQPTQSEAQIPHDDGVHTYISIQFPLTDMHGVSYAVCGISTDITQRKQIEDDAARAHAFLDSIIENIPHMVFVKRAEDLSFVRFNRAGEELLGHSRDELLGKNDYDFFSQDEATSFIRKDRDALASGRLVDIAEEPVATRSHGTRILHTKKIPIRDSTGEPRYLLGISEDITDRKENEDRLRQAVAQAERANVAKSEFLSRMSHELRTPLNAILGFAQVLELEGLDASQEQCVQHILKGGKHLLELINEVLDLAKIEAGRLTISLEPVSVNTVVQESLELIRPLGRQRQMNSRSRPASCKSTCSPISRGSSKFSSTSWPTRSSTTGLAARSR